MFKEFVILIFIDVIKIYTNISLLSFFFPLRGTHSYHKSLHNVFFRCNSNVVSGYDMNILNEQSGDIMVFVACFVGGFSH
jgi:hypothetical protein